MKYDKSDPKTIQKMFNTIAKSYDRTNAILSFRLHRYWNRQLIHSVMGKHHPESMLDLCSGTGEIALTYLQKASRPCQAYLLDFSSEMLTHAQMKASLMAGLQHHTLSFLQADAQVIPLGDHTIHCATVAYGIRNVNDPKKCLSDVFRVLQPGGVFGILELTRPDNRFLRFGHTLYLHTLLPVLGWCFSANKEAYQYLCNSIHQFVKPNELVQMMQTIGFQEIKKIPLSGGIATIIIAKKPL